VEGGGVYVWDGFTMQGGTISGNTAAASGGVAIQNATFAKTGGTIYGSASDSLKNTASSNNGHAVYVYDGTPLKKRNTTAGAGVNLHFPLKGDTTDNNWGQ
jgi:hypothetical protein